MEGQGEDGRHGGGGSEMAKGLTDTRKSGGWMLMEWIEGTTVRNALNLWLKARGGSPAEHIREEEVVGLMARIGQAVGKIHAIGVVHGDLTTSNLMVRSSSTSSPSSSYTNSTSTTTNSEAEAADRTSAALKGEIVLIDFGLSSQTVQDEDKAVDLYVLERAFGSTHPGCEDLFLEVLKTYGRSYKGATIALKRLEGVRQRGRKRNMLG